MFFTTKKRWSLKNLSKEPSETESPKQETPINERVDRPKRTAAVPFVRLGLHEFQLHFFVSGTVLVRRDVVTVGSGHRKRRHVVHGLHLNGGHLDFTTTHHGRLWGTLNVSPSKIHISGRTAFYGRRGKNGRVRGFRRLSQHPAAFRGRSTMETGPRRSATPGRDAARVTWWGGVAPIGRRKSFFPGYDPVTPENLT